MMRHIRNLLALVCITLSGLMVMPLHAMGNATKELRLSYNGEAYRAWPVIFGFRFNGVLNLAPEATRCCIEDNRAPGGGSGTAMGISYNGDVPDIDLEIFWNEVHSDIAYRARVTFSTDEIVGWTGGNVVVTFSFRPGGELVLYGDGPALAATRTGPDLDIRSGEDMAAVLLAPGLGRAHVRDDYIELRRVCGTVDTDPPEAFRDGRAAFAPSVLKEIDADRTRPLPSPNCEAKQ